MTVQIVWGNDNHTLIISRFISPWNANELMHVIDEGIRMISTVSHKVDVIIDFQQAKAQIPTQYLPVIMRMRQIGLMNRGRMVVVGAPYFIQSLIKFAQEFAPVAYANLYFAADLKAAEAMLQEMRENRA